MILNNMKTSTTYYTIKDYLGNVRKVMKSDRTIVQAQNYYPFGSLLNDNGNSNNIQTHKYNSKELDRMHGLDLYDYGARHYDATIGQFTTMDPLCEKYYHISPYAYCGGNPVNAVDPDGRDWYRSSVTGYYYWFNYNLNNENYTYIGEAGSLLGSYEKYINQILIEKFDQKGLYTSGLCLDIAALDKGALLPSKVRGWDILDEFVMGVGPVVSIFTSQHEYTKELMNIELAYEGQKAILNGAKEFSDSYDFGLWDVVTTSSFIKQFIGSYNYLGVLSKDKKNIYNIIADGKSLSSLMYHLTPQSWNQSRDIRKSFGNTYQFYIWQTKVK